MRRPPKAAEGHYHLVFDEEGEYRLGDTSPGIQESHAQQALARASAAGRDRSAEAAAVLVGLGGDGISLTVRGERRRLGVFYLSL